MSNEEQGNQPPSDLVLKFGEALLDEPDLKEIEWDSLGLVMDYREGFVKSHQGFTYLYKPKDYIKSKTDYNYFNGPNGPYGWRPFAPDTVAAREGAFELYNVMKSKSDRIWHKALVHLVAETGAFNIHLEYDDPTRWEYSSNYRPITEFKEEIRPK